MRISIIQLCHSQALGYLLMVYFTKIDHQHIPQPVPVIALGNLSSICLLVLSLSTKIPHCSTVVCSINYKTYQHWVVCSSSRLWLLLHVQVLKQGESLILSNLDGSLTCFRSPYLPHCCTPLWHLILNANVRTTWDGIVQSEHNHLLPM